MKIGVFTPYLDSLTGGERYMLSIAECLASNHEVSIFWNTDNSTHLKQTIHQKLGIDLKNVKFTKNIFTKDTTFLKRYFDTQKYNQIIFLSDGSIPVVASHLILHFQFPVEWVNGNNFISKAKLKRVDKIICNSQFTKNYIDRKFSMNSVVLYPPIDYPKEITGDKLNRILHVGRFEETSNGSYFKKQDILIEAFKKLLAKDSQKWKLQLVMSVRDKDTDKISKLRELAKGYDVEFHINVTKDELSDLYKQAKIYWHASGYNEDIDKNPEKAEHFGITTVEAMSYGLVPVVINVGGQKEIVDDNTNGFLWISVEQLVEKTQVLIKNEKLWNELSINAREKAKRFRQENFCSELQKIIDE